METKSIEERNRIKHTNSLAKEFFCAMLSNAEWFDINMIKDTHRGSLTIHGYSEYMDYAFEMAELFVEKESNNGNN